MPVAPACPARHRASSACAMAAVPAGAPAPRPASSASGAALSRKMFRTWTGKRLGWRLSRPRSEDVAGLGHTTWLRAPRWQAGARATAAMLSGPDGSMFAIPSFESARVLVGGDVMLDRYWHGDTGRISPEAPVPVVRIGDEEQRLGGAGNVALNLARLGGATTLIGVVGDDAAAAGVRALLDQAGVDASLLVSATHPTIDKLRVMSHNQQLIRLDAEQSFADDGAFDTARLCALFE